MASLTSPSAFLLGLFFNSLLVGGVFGFGYLVGWFKVGFPKIEVNKDEGALSFKWSSFILFYYRNYDVPLSEIRKIRARFDNQDNIELNFYFDGNPLGFDYEGDAFTVSFEHYEFPEHADKDQRKAVVMGLAHVCGLTYYRIINGNGNETVLEFCADPQSEEYEEIPQSALDFLEELVSSSPPYADNPVVPEMPPDQPPPWSRF